MTYKSLAEKLEAVGNPVDMARNSQIGPYVYPKVAAEFTNWRDEQHSWVETCALFDQSHHMTDLYIEGPDVIPLLSSLGVNTLRELRREQGQAVRRVQRGRLRDRRRDPLLPRREQGQPRRAPLRAQLGAVPRGDRRLRREVRARRADGGEPDRAPQALPLPGSGPDRAPGAREGERRAPARDQVLQHGRGHDRGAQGPRAAPRHVRRARDGAVRPVGGRRRGQGGARRGRRGVRALPGGLAGVRDEHPRVGLDPVPAARRVHGRLDEGLPRVAARRRLRGAPARSAGATTPTTSATTT